MSNLFLKKSFLWKIRKKGHQKRHHIPQMTYDHLPFCHQFFLREKDLSHPPSMVCLHSCLIYSRAQIGFSLKSMWDVWIQYLCFSLLVWAVIESVISGEGNYKQITWLTETTSYTLHSCLRHSASNLVFSDRITGTAILCLTAPGFSCRLGCTSLMYTHCHKYHVCSGGCTWMHFCSGCKSAKSLPCRSPCTATITWFVVQLVDTS